MRPTHSFLEGWNAIFAGEMPDIAPLLARAARRLPSMRSPIPIAPHEAQFLAGVAGLLGHFQNCFCLTIGLRETRRGGL